MAQPDIHDILRQSIIRYSQVWEDDHILQQSLSITDSDHVLSIGSAGCNAFSLLLAGAKRVVAVDLNPAQIALIHLKKEAIRQCSLKEYRNLLGVDDSSCAVDIYNKIRSVLPADTQFFWDNHQELLAAGIIHTGKLDKYFRIFQQKVIQKLVPPDALEAYLLCTDRTKQIEFFDRYFCHPTFVQTFKQYTSQEMIASSGRDPAQFAFVTQKDIGSYFYDRFRFVCTEIPARNNYYLHYLLSGSYTHIAPPQYRPDEFALLKTCIDRLDIRHDGLLEAVTQYPEYFFTKANLSDLFEYLSEEDTQSFLETLAERMNPTSTIAYWNLLVPRFATSKWNRNEQYADELHQEDRCFFYSKFIVESIVSA